MTTKVKCFTSGIVLEFDLPEEAKHEIYRHREEHPEHDIRIIDSETEEFPST